MKKVFPKIIARLQITFTGLCMSRLYILILRFDHRNIAKIFYTSLNKKAGSKGGGLEIPFIRTYLFCKLVKIFEIARYLNVRQFCGKNFFRKKVSVLIEIARIICAKIFHVLMYWENLHFSKEIAMLLGKL